METFMYFNRSEQGDEVTIRTSAIIALFSNSNENYTRLVVSGIAKPIDVLGNYEDVKTRIERASK